MPDYGIKISKSGYDVDIADIKDQVFNSTANSLKIAITGSGSLYVPEFINFPIFGPVSATATISHDLGYIPGYLVLGSFGDSRWYLPYSYDLFSGYGQGFTVRADSTNLYITFSTHSDSDYTAYYRYYLFVDPGV